MPNVTPSLLKMDSVSKMPPSQRPGAWGWYDEEFVETREPSRVQVEAVQPAPEPLAPIEFFAPTPQKDGTFISFNDVQVIENTTTQPDDKANGSIAFANPIAAAETVVGKIDPLLNITTKAAEVTVEAASDIFDIFKQVAGTGEYAAKAAPTEKSQKKAEDEHKLKEIQLQIKQFQMQAREAKQAAQMSEKAKIEQTMVRVGVSAQEVMTHEGSVTIANIFWIAVEKTKHHVKKAANKLGAGRGKSKNGAKLDMNLSAQEGQSMVSSSGAIASAG